MDDYTSVLHVSLLKYLCHIWWMCHVLLCGWEMIQFFRLLEASFMATFLIAMTNGHQKQLENKSSFSCLGRKYCPSQW